MTWYLIVYFAATVVVEAVPSKLVCDDLRGTISAQYGKGSSFIAATCVSVESNGGRK